jgi:ABC-type Fe3+-hydroxamate transport system substrate-binding protein
MFGKPYIAGGRSGKPTLHYLRSKRSCMASFTDATGHTISIGSKPQRIISLVPSLTEFIANIGCADQLVGITKFCIHPDFIFQQVKRVGGTKTIHIDQVQQIQPDLIIANKEENVLEQIQVLQALYPVYTTHVPNVKAALDTLSTLGSIVSQPSADRLVDQIKNNYQALVEKRPLQAKKVLYLIWKKPYMSVGGDTFIHDMLFHAGFDNVCADYTRYPIVDPAFIANCQADLIFLSSEPYPFRTAHFAPLQALLPKAMIQLVDGELFSWYGSRMQKACVYLEGLRSLHHQTQ